MCAGVAELACTLCFSPLVFTIALYYSFARGRAATSCVISSPAPERGVCRERVREFMPSIHQQLLSCELPPYPLLGYHQTYNR